LAWDALFRRIDYRRRLAPGLAARGHLIAFVVKVTHNSRVEFHAALACGAVLRNGCHAKLHAGQQRQGEYPHYVISGLRGSRRAQGAMLANVSKPQYNCFTFMQNGTAGETIVFQKQ
jgi:hypothetical protein